MYSLQLSAEQIEIRDLVRDFVTQEVKPVLLKADRLNVRERSLPIELLVSASRMGMRTLALSEERGGAGADALTCCIVSEELAAGDADFASVLSETSRLGHVLFDLAMNDVQCKRYLPQFLNDDDFHLALANREPETDSRLGVNYHRHETAEIPLKTVAVKSGDHFVINGVKDCVGNAPLARLFVVEVALDGRPRLLLVPADAPGLSVRVHEKPWRHGANGDIEFKDCTVPAVNLLDESAATLLAPPELSGRGMPQLPAINLGVGRAAYEAALEYAHIRVQGTRPIVEHQAIGSKLAGVAIKLEVARAAVWRAAWASDHPEAYSDRSLPDLPLQTIAQVFTAEAMLEAAKDAAEVFGAMGVMRDMPLQKYVHDARVCLHSGDGNADLILRIAEAIAGFRRAGKAVNGGGAAAAAE